MSKPIKRSRPPVRWIDRFDIGMGSSAVVTFVAVMGAVIFFSFEENLGVALFFSHCLFLFVTGPGLTEDIRHPEPHPEERFEEGYIVGAALSIIFVVILEFTLHAYFGLQAAKAVGVF